jgi:hypothetical protein
MGFGKIITGLDDEIDPDQDQSLLLFKKQAGPTRQVRRFLSFYLHPRNAHAKLKQLLQDHLPQGMGWDIVRKQAYRKANYQCCVCRGRGKEWPVAAADVWIFDKAHGIQRLENVIALCPECNQARYAAWKIYKGENLEAAEHFAKVNALASVDQAKMQAHAVVLEWKDISQSSTRWKLDVGKLIDFGVPFDKVKDIQNRSVIVPGGGRPAQPFTRPAKQYRPHLQMGHAQVVHQVFARTPGHYDDEGIPEDVIWDDIT